jgi:hypothetical protein
MQKALLFLLVISTTFGSLRSQSVVSVELQGDISIFILELFVGQQNVQYPVRTYKMIYTTTDVFGEPTEASGMISIPVGPNVVGDRPIAVYNHSTVDNREAVPSRPDVQERFLAHVFATNGYYTIAPDYLGLGDNPAIIHPYVHADSEAQAGYDMIIAFRDWLATENLGFTDQLYTTGYSQGGHASMALQQKLLEETDDLLPPATAAAHLSGPYGISTVMADVLFDPETETLPGYLAYTYISYNYVYGLFDDLGAVFNQPYATPIVEFSEGQISLGDLNNELFDLLAANSATLPEMFQDSILNILENEPDHPINVALRDNDTYNFIPLAPTMLYYCTEDEQVPFANALLADSLMSVEGDDRVTAINGGPLTHGGCVFGAIEAALEWFDMNSGPSAVFNSPVVTALAISPNPVSSGGWLRIEREAQTELRYEIISTTGQVLRSGLLAAGSDRIALIDVPAGIHYLRTNGQDGLTINKLIVQPN